MIVNEWDAVFTVKYGHHFPDTYLTFDTEYTGSNERDDLIMEIGHTMVEGGRVVDKMNLVLNWYNHPEVEATWLNYKLNNMRHIVGPGWRLMPDFVQKEGIDPIKALKFYHELLNTWKSRGLPFVAQNGQTADERLLRGSFNRYLNKTFSLPDNGYFDTGAIYKASLIWGSDDIDAINLKGVMLPHRTETLKEYFKRIIYTKATGVKWSLSSILDHYKLTEKHFVKPEELHTAGFDSMCLHWIMEEFRSRITKRNGPAEEFLSPADLQEAYEHEMAKHKLAEDKLAKTKAKEAPKDAPSPGQSKRTKPGLSQKRRGRRQRNI